MNDLNVGTNDLDLEFKDVVKDPNDPQMRSIETEIPVRYKDKDRDALVDMHINLEKVLTRQGNELGQLRKIAEAQDRLLGKATAPNPQTEPVKPLSISPENLLNDPVNSVNKVVENNPSVVAGNQRLNKLELDIQETKFASANPTYKQDINDPQFQSWVLGSKIRTKLLNGLDQYNFEAGNELWELWNEHQGAKNASETARQSRVGAVSVTRSVSGEPVGKPIYSRAKLMELHTRAINGDPAAKAKWEDPKFQNEYQLAHLEDRVR